MAQFSNGQLKRSLECLAIGILAHIMLLFRTLSPHSEADQQSFQFYKSGVFDDPSCGEALDHGVAAVGYGTSEDGKDYFKVRNSWVRVEHV
jgi:C1A family cysteine protease